LSPRIENKRPIESLDSKHIMSIILFLYENGPSRRTDIYNKVCRNGSMPQKFDTLFGCGLLTENATVDGIMLNLTDKGYDVARNLTNIEDIIR